MGEAQRLMEAAGMAQEEAATLQTQLEAARVAAVRCDGVG